MGDEPKVNENDTSPKESAPQSVRTPSQHADTYESWNNVVSEFNERNNTKNASTPIPVPAGRELPKPEVVDKFIKFVEEHNKLLKSLDLYRLKEYFRPYEQWTERGNLVNTKWFELNYKFNVDMRKENWTLDFVDKMLEYCSAKEKKHYEGRKDKELISGKKNVDLAEDIMKYIEDKNKGFNYIVSRFKFSLEKDKLTFILIRNNEGIWQVGNADGIRGHIQTFDGKVWTDYTDDNIGKLLRNNVSNKSEKVKSPNYVNNVRILVDENYAGSGGRFLKCKLGGEDYDIKAVYIPNTKTQSGIVSYYHSVEAGVKHLEDIIGRFLTLRGKFLECARRKFPEDVSEKTESELNKILNDMKTTSSNMKEYCNGTVKGIYNKGMFEGNSALSGVQVDDIDEKYLRPFIGREMEYLACVNEIANNKTELTIDYSRDHEVIMEEIYDKIGNVLAALESSLSKKSQQDLPSEDNLNIDGLDDEILKEFNSLVKKYNRCAKTFYVDEISSKSVEGLGTFVSKFNELKSLIYGKFDDTPAPKKLESLCTKLSDAKDDKAIKKLIKSKKKDLKTCLKKMSKKLDSLKEFSFKEIKGEEDLIANFKEKISDISGNYTILDFNSQKIDESQVNTNNFAKCYETLNPGKKYVEADNKNYVYNFSYARIKRDYLNSAEGKDVKDLVKQLPEFSKVLYDFVQRFDKDYADRLNDKLKTPLAAVFKACRNGNEKGLKENFEEVSKIINDNVTRLINAQAALMEDSKELEDSKVTEAYYESERDPQEKVSRDKVDPLCKEVYDKYQEFAKRRNNFVDKVSPENLEKYNKIVFKNEYADEWDLTPTDFGFSDKYDPFYMMTNILSEVMHYNKGMEGKVSGSLAEFKKRYNDAGTSEEAYEVVNEVYKKAITDLKELMNTQNQLEKAYAGEEILGLDTTLGNLKGKFKSLTEVYAGIYKNNISFFEKMGKYILGVRNNYENMQKANVKSVEPAAFLSWIYHYVLNVVAPLGDDTVKKFDDKCKVITDSFREGKTEQFKAQYLTEMYELAVRAVYHLKNKIAKQEAKKQKGIGNKLQKFLSFEKKEKEKQNDTSKDNTAEQVSKIEKCFKNVGTYFVKSKNFTRKDMKSKLNDVKKICPDWYGTLKKYLDDKNFILIKVSQEQKDKERKRIVSIAILLASLCGLPKTEYVISACDGLKNGGLKDGTFKGDRTYLADAAKIRKGIKNAAVVGEGSMDKVYSYMIGTGLANFEKLVDRSAITMIIKVFWTYKWKCSPNRKKEKSTIVIGNHRSNKKSDESGAAT